MARPWPSREVAALDQLERLLGKLEQPDQVGDRYAAAAHPAADLLLGEAEVVDEHRARARLLDRVQVDARHVLREREVEPLPVVGVADERGDRARAPPSARRAGGARRRPARSSRRPAAGRRSAGARRACGSTRPARASRAWSNVRRGWRAFGWIRSGGISRRPSSTLSLRGRIAASPRPIPRCCASATCGHLLRQLQVRRAPGAVRRVPQDREAEARRLAEPDVARHDRVEHQRRGSARAPRARRRAPAACARRAS